MSIYLVSLFVLIIVMLVYLKIAKRFNIVDKPNHRSSHEIVTIRGGGIVFPISILLFFLTSGFSYPFFSLAIILISVVSFIDDIKPLKAVPRLFFHLISALLVIAEFIPEVSVLVIPIILFIILGGVNAYNFMDGINGITSTYSLVILLSFLYLNQSLNFIDNDIIVLPLISVIVFSFFNFRKKALCFSGDVGSLSIALLILFILIKLIVFTQQPLYGLLLMVYAMDTALTMFKRKMNGENILKPHRSHLYQILANEKGFSHLKVSVIYGISQLFINYLVIFHIIKPNNSYFWGLALIAFTLVSYVFIKNKNERTIN